MPLTKEICPKCKFGKLFAVPLENSFGHVDGYRVESPIRTCNYAGFRDQIDRVDL